MKELYKNEFYNIQLVTEDTEAPYHVYHNEHEVCGGNMFDNYPQALIIATQFEQMLHNDMWKREMIRSAPISMVDQAPETH